MAQNLARDYADSLIKTIQDNTDSGYPFGVVDLNTDNYYSDLEDAYAQVDPGEARDNLSEASGMDYLADVLDIKYIVNSDRTYRAAKVCVGYGGPNVWINTDSNELEVYWDTHETRGLPREFVEGLDDALSELWEMGA